MTFNLRFWNKSDKLQHWDNRKPLFFQVLEKYLPDIIGFQEVQPVQMEDLIEFLCQKHDYKFWVFDRSDGDLKSEGCPIFYRNVTVVKQGIFWLSKTPIKPSKHFGKHKRQCVWIQCSEPKSLVVMNTHLDHLSTNARIKGLKVLETHIPQISKELPVVLMGDFNFGPESKEYGVFSRVMKDSYLLDNTNAMKNEVTFHNFTGQKNYMVKKSWGKVINQRIDFLWMKGQIQVEKCQIIFDNPYNGNPTIYPSDHWAVLGSFV